MTSGSRPTELHRPVALDRIGPHGFDVVIEAKAEELPAIAERLRIVGLASLRGTFSLRRVGTTTIVAEGALQAELTETCVVTLDPFDHAVSETFTVHFVPAGTEDDDPDPEAIDQIPSAGSTIDLGEALVEQLALVLDPYPRRPGAELPGELAAEPSGLFAALLARRKPD